MLNRSRWPLSRNEYSSARHIAPSGWQDQTSFSLWNFDHLGQASDLSTPQSTNSERVIASSSTGRLDFSRHKLGVIATSNVIAGKVEQPAPG